MVEGVAGSMNTTCYLCGSSKYTKRPGSVRNNKELEVRECSTCSLVYLSSFEHINKSFYEDSGMHATAVDIDAWIRETDHDDNRRFDFLQRAITNKSVLDFGCGVGGFLLKARSIASHVAGIELERRLKPWFEKNNLTVSESIDSVPDAYDVITAFHVVEHLADPKKIIQSLAQRLNSGGEIIIEVPSSTDALLTIYNNEAFSHFTYWECHLFLFNDHTLRMLAAQAGLKVKYIKQVQRYPLSNHLYWLAQDKPGGHKQWAFFDSQKLNEAYEASLASIGACDTIIASFIVD